MFIMSSFCLLTWGGTFFKKIQLVGDDRLTGNDGFLIGAFHSVAGLNAISEPTEGLNKFSLLSIDQILEPTCTCTSISIIIFIKIK